MIDLLTLRVVAACTPAQGTVYRWTKEDGATYECAKCALEYCDVEIDDGVSHEFIGQTLAMTGWLVGASPEVVCEKCGVELITAPLVPA